MKTGINRRGKSNMYALHRKYVVERGGVLDKTTEQDGCRTEIYVMPDGFRIAFIGLVNAESGPAVS